MDVSAGATGWYTISYTFAMFAGVIVCMIVGSVLAKPLADRGKSGYLPWLVIGSLVLTTVFSQVELARHMPDKLMYSSSDNIGPRK